MKAPAKKLIERLTRYAKICTTSDRRREETPTTPGQRTLAKMLVEEFSELGIKDVTLTENCYVIARLPGNAKGPVIGFLAHLDTSSEVSGENVNVIVEELPDGKTVVRTDGKTLLGGDDKAGIAILMTVAEYFAEHPEAARPDLEIIFSPDEETGKGLPGLPLEKLRARYCYTVDGGGAPEIEAECFNAHSAKIYFSGKVIHPGEARGRLVNAAAMAAHFVAQLPRSESPEATDGYYGYYCVMEISGTQEAACAELIIRDFEREGMTRRLCALEAFARATEAAFPGGNVRVETELSYRNMKEKIDAAPEVMEKLLAASRAINIEPRLKPIRGGTDGSRLTELGIPTPNIWTGGRNFHSRDEWVSVEDMCSSAELIAELARLWGEAS